jgi:hypothetical protein
MIDEFQDTNGAQYAIVKSWWCASEHLRIGRDAQASIHFTELLLPYLSFEEITLNPGFQAGAEAMTRNTSFMQRIKWS